MKKISLFLSLLVIGLSAYGQLVQTIAGQVEMAGSNDGPAFDATFNNPHGIAVDEAGNVYIADRWSHTIRILRADGRVVTLAGRPGQSGDTDGQALDARFNEPWGICVDRSGIVYVADTRNNKIRKVTPNGIVTTLAGNGRFGVRNGQGLSASFGNPTGIECDSTGQLYIADHLTHTIRKIDTSGMVTTLAGRAYLTGDQDGFGTQASFARPYGLSLDNEGNIIVADEWNHKIRKVSPQGMVSTIAGNGSVGGEDGVGAAASFNFPWDVTIDPYGNIFVADGYNYIIRKITPDNTVRTYAGEIEVSGASDGQGADAHFSGATAIASTPGIRNLYVGDAYNNLIRKIIQLDEPLRIQEVQSKQEACEGDSLSFTCTPAIYTNYQFFLDEQLIQNSNSPQLPNLVLSPGIHFIKVIASSDTASLQSNDWPVEVHPPEIPIITTTGDSTIQQGDSIVLSSSPAQSYHWSNGQTEVNIIVDQPGNYSVSTIDDNGCEGHSAPLPISLKQAPVTTTPTLPTELDLFVPTAFTPNGDGENDVLYVRGSLIEDFIFRVYNQWGALIFQSEDQQYGWDGMDQGQPAQVGNYVYLLSTQTLGGEKLLLSGHVLLLR